MAVPPAPVNWGSMAPVGYLETGVLYCDDNLRRLSEFPASCIDLIYLDPPFFSNRQYEVIWGDEAEVRSFEDRWQGGIHVYIEWMRHRLMELHRVLKPSGTLYLHCDEHASHYLKIALDEIFGPPNFRSEITWKRTNVHSDSKSWSAVADTIFYYVKDARQPFAWNPTYTAYSDAYLQSKYRYRDASGRRYRLDNMTSPNPRLNMMYEWKGHASPSAGWRFERATMQRLDTEGRIWYPDRKSKRPQLKRFLDEMPGTLLTNIWTDIDPINSQARERLGYPTQKPTALLERIIGASSNPGDIVLDPFCGCGTTVVAAEGLGRQWIGIDISPTAVNLMKLQVEKAGTVNVKLVGMPVTVEQLQALKPFEFQNWVIGQMHGTHSPRKSGDMGIDGYAFMSHDPIQVKQSAGVGRNVVDNFETALKRAKHTAGQIVAFSFGRGAYEEVARAKTAEGLEIRLTTVADLLENAAEIVTPGGAGLPLDLPLPSPRPADRRPTVAQLVASDRQPAPPDPN